MRNDFDNLLIPPNPIGKKHAPIKASFLML